MTFKLNRSDRGPGKKHAKGRGCRAIGPKVEWEGPCEYREQEERMLWVDASISFAA